MTMLTQAQVLALAVKAGFPAKEAEVAAAIAMVESLAIVDGTAHADTTKVGDVGLVTATWGPSYGLWQIRSLRADTGTGRYRDALRLPDPDFNAASAFTVWSKAGKSFQPWSTYTSGAYQGYMQQAVLNPKPVIPPGSYMVTGGDYLSRIGAKTGFPWQLIAAINRIAKPYTIYPGQVILLPDYPYTVRSGDTLSGIAAYAGATSWQRIAEYNGLKSPYVIHPGQVLKIPRYTAWDGTSLTL